MINTKFSHYVFIILFLTCIFGKATENDAEIKKMQLIVDIESKVILPPGSHKLQNYVRYYQFVSSRHNSKKHAVYILEEGVGGIKIVGKE